MDRKQISKEILAIKSPYIVTELATGTGKSKIALDWLAKKAKKGDKILIVIPRLVLIDNWKKEIKKWKKTRYLNYIKFVTYVSFPKVADEYKVVIFDECHHLSERCQDALKGFKIHNAIFLSATVGRNLREQLPRLFNDVYIYKIGLKDAIKSEILPDPVVYLLPLHLDTKNPNQIFTKNKGKGNPITIDYRDRWKVKAKTQIDIRCTQWQYHNELCGLIDFYKRKAFNSVMEKIYLHKCGERLKWLASQKQDLILRLLDKLSSNRTLTFCSSIEQTEQLGKYCVNSKNKDAISYLQLFNKGKINHITACNMLDEGQNLTDCQIGIFVMINSSDKLIIQRTGRLLRHQNPYIIIPYWCDTREQEIVNKMKENYNPSLIKTISSINEIEIE